MATINLEGRLADAVLEYLVRPGQRFHLTDMSEYVRAKVGECAPDSPARVMRELRRSGRLNYACVNRHASLYEVRQ